jgi:hypothetical protein
LVYRISFLLQVIYWDPASIYMEHRFITPKDDFVRAIAVCKQRVLGVNVDEIMQELLSTWPNEKVGTPERGYAKPDIPLEVLRWDEANQISSANLRNGC